MPLRKIPEKIDSKFRYVLLAATRAEQLMHGASPKVDFPLRSKTTSIAMEEILTDAVKWGYGPEPPHEPGSEPEPEADTVRT